MKNKAFTLVELLIVVVIIGILATFVVLALGSATKRTRDARAKRSIESVRDAVEQYMAAVEDADLTSAFGSATLEVKPGESFDSILKSSGATGFSSVPTDAKGNPIRFQATSSSTYRIEGRTSGNNEGSANRCWFVLKTTTGLIDNLSGSRSEANCRIY